MMDLFNITFGALLGALLTIMTSISLDKRREKNSRRYKLRALLAEMETNTSLVSGYTLGGGYVKQRLANSAWNTFLGDIHALPEGLQESLRKSYASIQNFNSLVEYDFAKLGRGDGSLNGAIEVKSNEVKKSLGDSISKLMNFLNGM